jgi:hypothetical protein
MRLAVVAGLVILAAAAVLVGTAPVDAQPEATVRIDHVDVSTFPNVRLTVTIVGPDGRPKLGLNGGNFDVLQSGYPVSQLDVKREQGGAVDLVMAIDVSRSMAGAPLGSAKQTAVALVDALGPADRAAIVSFADNTRPLVDFTSDKDALKQAIQGLEAGAYTAFYDGVFTAVRIATTSPAAGRAVVVISDGQEYSPEPFRDPASIVQEALTGGIQVYTVYFGIEQPTLLFTEVGAITGGRHFDGADSALIGRLTAHVQETLRQRYVLEFPSSVQSGTDVAPIAVRVKLAGQELEATSSLCSDTPTPIVWLPQIAPGSDIDGSPVLEPGILCSVSPIARVEYLLDGDTVHAETMPPFAYTLYADKLERGHHLLTLRLTDADGSQTTKDFVFGVSGSTFNSAYLLLVVGAAVIIVFAFAFLAVRRGSAEATASAGPVPTPVPATTPAQPGGPAGSVQACLITIAGPTEGQVYPLASKAMLIGRAAECDIVLGGAAVSRQHARITRKNGRCLVQDLGSTNGTLVNGKRIKQAEIAPGDELQVGDHRLRLAGPGQETSGSEIVVRPPLW